MTGTDFTFGPNIVVRRRTAGIAVPVAVIPTTVGQPLSLHALADVLRNDR